jgi:hypothetical protein
MTLTGLITKLKSLSVQRIAEQTLKDHEETMADLQRSQLLKGRTSTGEAIVPDYAFVWYAKKKREMNPLAGYGTPDLKLTGSFHNSIKYRVSNGGIRIEANDPNNLEGRYKNIFGLNQESRKELIQKFLEKTLKANITRELK